MPAVRRGPFRPFPLDGALLRFDRVSGENQLWSGPEMAHLRQRAPRVLQVSVTNVCNKACDFCYRPADAQSAWTFDGLLGLARFADRWGVLELALGGGEPTLLPRFGELVRAVWEQTGLAVNFTTNGARVTRELLAQIRGRVGQIQLSVYDDGDALQTIDVLTGSGVRFGLNYLVTPARLRTLEADLYAFVQRGVSDVLLLSYKGTDGALHLSAAEAERFDVGVARAHRVLGGALELRVDVCWGPRLSHTPRLFEDGDCGAGDLFLSITSDRRVLACSFAEGGVPFCASTELPAIWETLRTARSCATHRGCTRRGNSASLLPTLGARRSPLPMDMETHS